MNHRRFRISRCEEEDRKLKAGMTLAIEPMVNLGTERIRWMSDNWTVVTADRKRISTL